MSIGLLSGTGGNAHFDNASATEAPGKQFQIPLSFQSQSLTVDNFAGTWLFCVELNKFYPPQWRGTIDLTGGLMQFTFRWANPPGILSTIITPPGEAFFYFTDIQLTPSGGYPVSSIGPVARVIGQYTTAIACKVDGPYTVPAGTVQIVVIYDNNGPPVSLQGEGVQTNAIYPAIPYPSSSLGVSEETISAIPFFYGGPDTQINIFHCDITNGSVCSVLALFVPLQPTVEAILANQNGPLGSANPLFVQTLADFTWSQSHIVTFDNITATTTLVAGVSSQSITVLGWEISGHAGGGAGLTEGTLALLGHTSGNVGGARRRYVQQSASGVASQPAGIMLPNAPTTLVASEALDANIQSISGTTFWSGEVYYVQQ